ncbi:MAG: hypothetical protein ACYCSQ_00895 [bacterium]
MVVNINNIERKVSIITAKDAYVMRIEIINRLIRVLHDYTRLPDITKDERLSILDSIGELKEKIKSIRELIIEG